MNPTAPTSSRRRHDPEQLRIAFPGGDLACEVSGRGPPFLLIHSVNAAASRAEMDALAARLARRFRVYNLDLPGFGASERPRLRYDVSRFVAGVEAATAHALAAEGAAALHAAALSLSCEFLARAAMRDSALYRTLTLISPTGFEAGSDRLTEPPGSTSERKWLTKLLETPAGPLIYAGFTRPASIRFFLRRAFGGDEVDRHVLDAALAQPGVDGAEHAPLAFISGRLFSRDISTVYRSLAMPVLLAHGLRGYPVDVSAEWPSRRTNWTVRVYDTGALPQVELPDLVGADIAAHADGAPRMASGGREGADPILQDAPRGL